MNANDKPKISLDGILESIRAHEPARVEIDAAAARVRAALGLGTAVATSAVHIENCAGFQALIPGFIAGKLRSEMALLLEDHGRECLPCRRALIAARTPKSVPSGALGTIQARPSYVRWASAAAVASLAVLGAYTAWQAAPFFGSDPQLKVMRVDGALYQVSEGKLVALRPGMKVSGTNAVRTAKDSGALVMMDDGSRIEMRDRTEFTVAKRRDGSTVRLDGGAVIVEASPQGSGHLDVRTHDCLVAVKGTIFSVNAGTKGSRVSVVEGAVRVAADGRESLLKPGDQMTTSDAVQTVSLDDEIGWSQDASRYVALLRELASLRKDLEARVPNPSLRYRSTILDRLPEGTILYAAIPNLTESLVTAKQVFEEHVAQNGALQAWWNEHMSSREHRDAMDAAFEKMKDLGTQLGDEIVIALAQTPSGQVRGPILMAEVKDKAMFRATLVRQLNDMNGERPEASLKFDGPLVRIEFQNQLGPFAASRSAAQATTAWEDSPFRAKLQAAYEDGTSWLFGVDLKAMLAQAVEKARAHGEGGERVANLWQSIGVMDAEYLIFERTESADGANLHAEVSFDQPRRGIAGWLAAPAPLRAAEFVSPDAGFAAAAMVKRPEAVLAEALSWIDPEMPRFESAADLDAIRALAGTLGGDVAVALDGPILPVPSWRVIIEVPDPAAFQTAFESLAARANDHLVAEGQNGRIEITREDVGNRTDWVVRFTGQETELNTMRYTITDGYLIAAPSRVLIDQTIERQGNGYALVRSPAFVSLLPSDNQTNVSGFVWEHLGPTVGPIASRISGTLDSEQAKALEAMAAESRPHLVTACAEDQRIVVSSRGGAGFGSMLGSIISGNGSLGALGHVLDHARPAGGTPAQ